MPARRRRPTQDAPPVADYRYDASRKNIPRAGLAAQGRVRETPKLRYAYDPHLPPELRFDATGESGTLPMLLEEAKHRPLRRSSLRFSGTTSLPFSVGAHKRCAVKVIDPRGNEVMRVHRLEGYTL